MGATNRLHALDRALVRKGRFDFLVEVPLPDADGRRCLLMHYAAALRHKTSPETFTRIAAMTEDFHAADIVHLLNCAAYRAILLGETDISEGIFQEVAEEAIVEKEKGLSQVVYTFEHEGVPDAKFENNIVGGIDEDIIDILCFLKFPEAHLSRGIERPNGLLLTGPPGTGKTTIARCLAGEAGLDFIQVSGADFAQKYIGEGKNSVHALFAQARQLHRSVIIFIDEIDAVGRKRSEEGNQEDARTLNALLTEMSNPRNANILVVAATNKPDLLDPALKRSKRFDFIVKVGLPNKSGIVQITKFYLDKVPYKLTRSEFKEIVKGFKGLSGADIASIVNRANVIAMRKRHQHVRKSDLDEAKAKHIQYKGFWGTVGGITGQCLTRYLPGGKEVAEGYRNYRHGSRR